MDNEREIQAEIYNRLKLMGISCKLEEKIKVPINHTYKNGAVRDLVVVTDVSVYRESKLVCVVECKHRPKKSKPKQGLQFKRYQKMCEYLNIPFYYCMNESQIEQTINFIMSDYSNTI